jgi:hypothetical protein
MGMPSFNNSNDTIYKLRCVAESDGVIVCSKICPEITTTTTESYIGEFLFILFLLLMLCVRQGD